MFPSLLDWNIMFDTLDTKLKMYLDGIINGTITELPQEYLDEFKEECAAAVTGALFRKDEEFRLRMSNIGKDARSLWLEKNYGRETPTPDFLIKMTYGHLIEKLFILLLKSAGVEIEKSNEVVTLELPKATIKGEYDVKIDGAHWDFKTASDFSYTQKFVDAETVARTDTFGYVGQAVAYAQADATPFGGWFVINKITGEFKCVDGSSLNSPEAVEEQLHKFDYNIDVVNGDTPVPECSGVEEETYYKKPTGNKVLGRSCAYCPNKEVCHPGIKYAPSVCSTAKAKPWVWYVELNNLEGTIK